MLNILPRGLKKKKSKYPIKRDESGQSARQRCFDTFDSGKGPAEVSRLAGTSLRTSRRYYADWKKLPDNMGLRYHMAKSLWKKSEFREDTIEIIASSLGMSEEEVEMRLQKPWGMKQLLMGKWPNYRNDEQQRQFEARLEVALRLVRFVENTRKEPEKVEQLVSKVIDEVISHETPRVRSLIN